MPRISAASVPEHHAMRERDILEATVALLDSGSDVTMGEVARRCNMGRSSLYGYFPSTQHLTAAAREHRDRTVIDAVMASLGGTDHEQALSDIRQAIKDTGPAGFDDATHIARALLAMSAHMPREASALARTMVAGAYAAAVEQADRGNP